MAKRNKVYRTAQGRSVDFGALLLANENEPALGNMNVNARGDQINSDGEIVKSREEIMKEYNKLKIISWSINVKWSDGTEEKLTDCDDTTASYVDDYLTEKENERNTNE